MRISLPWWRRLAQVAFLGLFLFLFRKTDYGGTDEIPYAVNIFFRWDPLVAASAMLGARAVIPLLLPALAVLALTVVLGRFFCGWVCPLGTLLDAAHPLLPPRQRSTAGRFRAWKYYLLALILVTAALGLPLVGYFDPFSLLVRGLTLSLDPALYKAVTAPLDYAFAHAPAPVTAVTEPINSALRSTLLPYRQSVYALALPSLLLLVAVFALEKIERRFWCRNLCPLGALLALGARRTLLRRQPGTACSTCNTCGEVCRMGAIQENGRVSPEACNLCLDCIEPCPKDLITFNFKRVRPAPAPLGVSRRGFLGTVAAGAALPAFFATRAALRVPDPYLVRPPGARPEDQFLSLCVRCGECMKVCIGNALQPAFLETGAEGWFSPVLVSRVGYCEFNCTLCGQVCPTQAIRRLPVAEKQTTIIGRAFFDKNRCLPYAKGEPCIVCEEHCPVPEKAILFRDAVVKNQRGEEVTVQQPYVVDSLCIGCGICENKCPVPGEAAVRVTREGEVRT